MISITEVVLMAAGFAAIILGYLLPAGRDVDEGEKKLMEKHIRELVQREVEEQKETIENMVDDTVDNSLDRTERAMERISNEKLSEINQYSDTVINDIHKNHDEVMFMYDMLNDKHKNLTNVVSEVAKKTNEAKQVVKDAEATARDAEVTARNAQATAKSAEATTRDAVTIAREAQTVTSNLASSVSASPHVMTGQEHLRAILLDETNDRLSGIRIPYMDKKEPVKEKKEEAHKDDVPEPIRKVKTDYIDEDGFEDLDVFEPEVIPADQIEKLHVIGNKTENNGSSAKVVPITDAIRNESKAGSSEWNMKELTANDPISQNRRIIEMHKAGKSNMVIARELGLGIGEVKLVIDLSNKHRKAR